MWKRLLQMVVMASFALGLTMGPALVTQDASVYETKPGVGTFAIDGGGSGG